MSGRGPVHHADALMRAESELVHASTDTPWTDDEDGNAHDLKSGRFKAKVPLGWRRMFRSSYLHRRTARSVTEWS